MNYPTAFLNRMQGLLKENYLDFVKSLSMPEQKAIFVNNNKISNNDFLRCSDFNLSPVEYEKSGFFIDNIKLGKHPLHHAGAFYVQDASAMFTVNALNFKGDELVLDMCAAPGGKTIQIANRLTSGTLVSNEIDRARSKTLFSNVERMGLKNVIITNNTPEQIAKAYANCFDVCLVDAPCSGEGMFRRGEEYVKEWNENLPNMCAERQLKILNEADKCLKQGGHLIYSTCTYEEIENEGVVQKFLSTHNYSLIKINSPFFGGVNMPKAVRIYPFINRGEGQFVAVLKKNEQNNLISGTNLHLKENFLAKNFLQTYTNLNFNSYEYNNAIYYVCNSSLIKKNINYLSLGVKLFNIENKIIKPEHYLFSAFGKNFANLLSFNSADEQIKKYLKGETLDVVASDGYGALLVQNCSLGGYKISAGKFKNLYPKGLRN